jgi:DNA replication and repair protein RecF
LVSCRRAAAAAIRERRGTPPLLLLDDVLSELDPVRRRTLAAQVGRLGQAVITATTTDAMPVEPDQVVDVTQGEARVRR